MAYCRKCGAQISDTDLFCPYCGASTGVSGKDAGTQAADTERQNKPQTDFSEVIRKVTDTKDTTARYSSEDIRANKVMAILAYLGILVLIPLFAAKESPFARFHANQGLILFLLHVVLYIIAKIPIVGWVVGVIGSIFCLVLAILGIVYAVQGKAKELPIIGSFQLLK